MTLGSWDEGGQDETQRAVTGWKLRVWSVRGEDKGWHRIGEIPPQYAWPIIRGRACLCLTLNFPEHKINDSYHFLHETSQSSSPKSYER